MSPVWVAPNGLRLVTHHHPGSLAAIHLWFDAGTAMEEPHERGAAHLLEHMLFKGSARFGVGEAAATVEALGGDLNAYTTWDQTVLHAVVLAEGWREALDVLADMAWASTLDPEELQREIDVVVEEIHEYDDDPDTVAEDALTARLFPDSPYGSPVLGTEESVRAITAPVLRRFWRRHYGAERCVISVVGPMDMEHVRRAVASLQPFHGKPFVVPRPPGPARTGLHRIDRGFETRVIQVGYRLPGDGHPDNAALEVLASSLGSGRAALLPAQLRFGRGLVADVTATTYTRRAAGSLELSLIPTEDCTQRALDALFEIIRDPARIPTRIIEQGRDQICTDLQFATESIETLGHDLVWFTARDGDPRGFERWRQTIASVRSEEVRAAADRWLRDPVILVLGDETVRTPRRVRPRSAPPRTVGPARSERGPIASVYLGWPGGMQAETRKQACITEAWAACVTAGAGPWGAVALAEALDRHGASLRAVAGRSSIGLQITGPVERFEGAMEILAAVLHEPRFDDQAWAQIQDEVALELDTLDDRPEERLHRRLWSLAWRGHPWAIARTRSRIDRINTDHLAAFHRRWITRERLVVGYAGSIDDRVERWVTQLIEALPTTAPAWSVPALQPPPRGHFQSRGGKEQALIVAATRTPPLHDPRAPALRLASLLLGAQSGPLFLELRERRSLAYSVWSRLFESPTAGLLTVGIATSPSRAKEAKRALLDGVMRFFHAGPTEEELRRVRAMARGQLAMEQQIAANRAARRALCGLYGIDPDEERADAVIRSVDAQTMRRAIEDLPPFFTVTVLPRTER